MHLDSKIQEDVVQFLNSWTNDSPVIQLQTSGSTGDKKLIDAPKKSLLESARMTGKFFAFSSDKTVLICLPINFIAGKMMLVRAIEYDMNVIICAPSLPLQFPDELKVDFAAMTPYQYQKCCADNPQKLTQIETVLLGGGSISEQLKNQILNNNHHVYHSYGMTETYSHIALRKINHIGEPFQALDGISLSQDVDQTLMISAPQIEIDQLKTHDIVRFVEANRFFFLGRKDNVINSGGIKLHPEEIEEKIAPFFNDHNFFIFGLQDEDFGEVVALFVESKTILDLDELSNFVSKYEVPKRIYFLESFRYTETGKINRKLTVKSIEI